MPDAKDAIAVGMLVLAVAVFVPMLVDATQSDKEDIAEIENGSSYAVTERLSVSLNSVDVTNSTATVEAQNTQTLNSSEKLLNTTETKTYTLDGERVDVTLESIRESGRGKFATVSVVYPATFGFGEASKKFFANMELIIVLVGVIIIFAVLAVVTD